jgi:dTDP-4-amino-4,6-dideoxygalactose transaminase
MTDQHPSDVSAAVPLLDLAPYHATVRADLLNAFLRVYDSGTFITGPELQAFEAELQTYLDAGHVIGVSSGTDALCAALLALGVDVDHEVITTPFTFIATASAIHAAGGRIRFADIEAEGFGLDPTCLEGVLGERTGAVIAVHLFGSPCRIREIQDVCTERGVALVEDAAQALGAYADGKPLGTFGRLGAFSFFPSKSLGALGDGGALVTNEAELSARLRRIRAHGSDRKHHHVEFGGNFRLDELQAAILRRKLSDLDARVAVNRRHAAAYDAAFRDLDALRLPPLHDGASFSLYTLRVLERRDELSRALAAVGIESRVHYPTPLHLQPALANLGYARGDFPNAEKRATEALSIPMYPELSERQRDRVIARIRDFFR